MMSENINAEVNAVKKNVLLSFVGNTDPWPYKGEPEDKTMERPDGLDDGAILGLCNLLDGENRIDVLYMFPSCSAKTPDPENNTEWRAEWIKEILSRDRPEIQCRILPLDIDDPTDFEQISKELYRNTGIVLNELEGEDCQFHINCTSATQQMTAVAYVFASTGRIPNMIRWQCKDPKTLKAGESRILEVNATFLEESAYLDRIKYGIQRLEFSSVRENLTALSNIADRRQQGSRKDLFKFMAKVFSAYAFLDMLNYEAAYKTMHEAELLPGCKSLKGEHKQLFDKQSKLLSSLKDCGGKETIENLCDLYYNMQRSFNRGAFADVLARFWRISEGSVYYVLENRWGINPRNVRNSKRKNLEALISADPKRFNMKYSKQFIGLDSGRFALIHVFKDSVFEDTEFAKFFEQDVKDMTAQRNGTIVAHGMGEVYKGDAETCIQYAERILCTLIPSAKKEIGKYPFKDEDLQLWATLL